MEHEHKKILGPSIWMIIISLLLFWLPGVGPLIAGYVGGKMAGDVSHAFKAALLPMVLVGVVVFFAITLIGLPIVGAIAGAAVIIYIAIIEIALIAGAVVGGLLASAEE